MKTVIFKKEIKDGTILKAYQNNLGYFLSINCLFLRKVNGNVIPSTKQTLIKYETKKELSKNFYSF